MQLVIPNWCKSLPKPKPSASKVPQRSPKFKTSIPTALACAPYTEYPRTWSSKAIYKCNVCGGTLPRRKNTCLCAHVANPRMWSTGFQANLESQIANEARCLATLNLILLLLTTLVIIWHRRNDETRICPKADSTLRTSRAVPHPSTIRALCRLTSEVERDPVHSTRYGRQRFECFACKPHSFFCHHEEPTKQYPNINNP